MKWSGRNFIGFAVSLLLRHTYAKKSLVEVRRSVWLVWQSWAKYSGPSWVFRQIYLLPGFWGREAEIPLQFQKREDEANKFWKWNFDYWPPDTENTGPEGRGGRGHQNFGILTFFNKGTPSKIRRWSLFVLCSFLIWCTPRVPWVSPGPWSQ